MTPERLNREVSPENLPPPLKEKESKFNHLRYRYLPALVPLDWIIVLTQPRKTFEEIEPLAEDIAQHRLIHPLLVARFNRENCQKYLNTLNAIWQTSYQIESFTSAKENGEEIFYILIAGERRLRAHRHLLEIGCETCHEEYGPGGCFERHFPPEQFPNRSVETRLCLNISPEDALDLQFSENTHMRVPPHEEAKAYSNYFRYKRELDPNYPLSLFARRVGRSPETIRNALRFCELPAEIQEYVEKGYIAYGIACEIARLKEKTSLDEESLVWWARWAVAKNFKVPDFRQWVTNHINERNSNQTMLGIFTEEQEGEARRRTFKMVVAREMVMGVWSFIHYIRKVNELFTTGKVGKKDSPYAAGSPRRIIRAQIDLLKQSLPQFRNLFPEDECAEAQEILSEAGEVLAQLEPTLPEEPLG